MGISTNLEKNFKPNCIQTNSVEVNELRIPILYRNTSITIVEEILQWITDKNEKTLDQWNEKHFKYILKEFNGDRESQFVFLFRN